MIYPDNFESKLGFDKIRALVAARTLCPLGARRVEAMAFQTDGAAIARQLDELAEMIAVVADARRPMPTDGFHDPTEALRRVRIEGTHLDVGELYDVRRSLAGIDALVRYFRSGGGAAAGDDASASDHTPDGQPAALPLLRRKATDVVTFPDLVRRIDRTLTPTGEVRDTASPELARIRRELDSTLSGIGRLLNNILRQAQHDGIVESGVTPTLRDGRLVLPVPPAYKRRLGGIVHDESATGRTAYVEPAAVVDANNRIRELEAEERQEIVRILVAITAELRPSLPDILDSYEYLADIDFLRAKALAASDMEASVPRLGRATDWIQARHPLLYLRMRRDGRAADVVPLDIRLDDDQRIVLISGPNAGGKSVCLETVGLLQYMLQCGLAVPMRHNSVCALYDNIMIDIGDEQSIDNDLSTYSSHLENMKTFLRHATPRTLVLVDEMGGGTEPQIGGAIAQAILGRLNEARVRGIITTHFTNLKLFADQTAGIVNGAMLYDRAAMRPLFRLEVGHAGSSFAIEIAHKIGLPADVIEMARQIVGSDYVNMDKYLLDIARDRRYWEQKRDKIHQQEKQLESLQAELSRRVDDLKAKRQELIRDAKDEAATLLRQANARIEETIRGIREAQADREVTKRLRQTLAQSGEVADAAGVHDAGGDAAVDSLTRLRGRLTPQQRRALGKAKRAVGREDGPHVGAQPATFGVGDAVRLRGQQTVGEVVQVNGRECVVAFGMLKSTIDMSRLEAAVAPRAAGAGDGRQARMAALRSAAHDPSVSSAVHDRRLHFRQQLDVRGMRADEALQAVAYYIDDAIMLSVGQVRILHGTGTGALRQAIRQYLSTVAGVADYHDEHVQFGGAGITVVNLD